MVAVLAILLTLFLQQFVVDEENNKQNYQRQLVSRVQSELEIVDNQIQEISDQVKGSESFKDFQSTTDYPYFIYDQDSIMYWSDFHYVPDIQVLKTGALYKFVEDKGFQYISRKTIVGDTGYTVYMLLPLHVSRENRNNYIQATYNRDIFSGESNTVQILAESDGIPITSKEGKYLFSIKFSEPVLVKSMPVFYAILVLISVAIVCLLYYLYRLTVHFNLTGKHNQAFIIVVLGLAAIRGAMLVFDFPGVVLDFNIFDPQLYASSDLNRSLGDLFLNELALLVVVLFVFRNYQRFPWRNHLVSASNLIKSLVSVGWLLSSILFLYLQYYVITLFYQSQWSLDIASIMDFSFEKFLSLLIIVINALIYFLITHLAITESLRLLGKELNQLIVHFSIAALIFITCALIFQWSWSVILLLSISYWSLLIGLNITGYLGQFNYISFLYLFLGSIFCAVVGAYAINSYEKLENISKKEQLADQLLNERDFLAEFLLSESSSEIRSDLFISNQMMFSPYTSGESVVRKIERVYINQHLDRYDISINVFDSRGDPDHQNATFLRYQDFISQFATEENRTEHAHLYFVNEITSDQLNRYLCFIQIMKLDILVGYIVLDLKLKRVVPNTVYPELLVNNNQSIAAEHGISYAIYLNNKLINTSGNFNYVKDFDTTLLNKELLFTRGTNQEGSHHLAVMGPSDRTAVVSSVSYPSRNVLANFSFLFIIFIFCIILFIVFYVFVFQRGSVKLNYATRIQLYLNLAFFLPLIIVSVTTLSLISSYSKKEVIEKYFEKAEGVRNNIVNTLEKFTEGDIDDLDMALSITQLSQYSELDVNLFDIQGRLIGTSQPKIYQYNLLSDYLNP